MSIEEGRMPEHSPTVEAMLVGAQSPTASLDEFLLAYDDDDAIWWRIACGHHMNLFDMAVERMQSAELALRVLQDGGFLNREALDLLRETKELM